MIGKIAAVAFMAVFMTGCKDEEIDIVMKSQEEQQAMMENYTQEDFKKVYEDIITEAEKMKPEDEMERKSLIRVLSWEHLYYETDLTDEEVRQLAEKRLKEDRMWKMLATQKYGFSVTEEEIDQYISENADKSELPHHLAFADALGLTLEELNHEFDRDVYEKNVLWLKLQPVLEEEYGTSNNEIVIQKFQEEVEKRLE